MNLPNRLTLMRVFLIPIFLFFMYSSFKFRYLTALAVFAAASVTDALDGHIARKYNLITTFGKFLDPLADKVLVISVLAVFVEIPQIKIGAVPLIIISAREFAVSGIRLLAAEKGTVIAAGIFGKIKTAFTMLAISVSFFWLTMRYDFNIGFSESVISAADNVIIPVMMWICAAVTVVSGIVYAVNYCKIKTDNTD